MLILGKKNNRTIPQEHFWKKVFSQKTGPASDKGSTMKRLHTLYNCLRENWPGKVNSTETTAHTYCTIHIAVLDTHTIMMHINTHTHAHTHMCHMSHRHIGIWDKRSEGVPKISLVASKCKQTSLLAAHTHTTYIVSTKNDVRAKSDAEGCNTGV